MLTPTKRSAVAGLLVVQAAFLVVVSGCSDESPVSSTPNLAPDTTLSVTYEALAGGGRRVRLEWLGYDEDGSVDHYLVRLDTLDWEEVTRTDTVFVFDEGSESSRRTDEEDLHSFSARAVDNLGKEDPTPAEASFWSRNQMPETVITAGPQGVTGPMVGIEWEGTDLDGVITSYQCRLWAWSGDPEYPWGYDPIIDSGPIGPDVTRWTDGPFEGLYKFEVWATDNEDGADPTPAERVFTCNSSLAGPELTVTTNVLGTHVFRGPVWPDEYNTPIEVSQQHLIFEWTADASDYGGQVVGYRHAYDDTSSWPQWSLDDTSFEITPGLGEHSLYIHALDDFSVMTRGRIFISVVEAGTPR